MEFIIYNACLYMFGKFQKKSRRGWGFFWNPGIFRFEGGNCPSLPILLGVSWLLKFPLDLQNPKICQFSKCWWTFFYFWLLFLHACCMAVHAHHGMEWSHAKFSKSYMYSQQLFVVYYHMLLLRVICYKYLGLPL